MSITPLALLGSIGWIELLVIAGLFSVVLAVLLLVVFVAIMLAKRCK